MIKQPKNKAINATSWAVGEVDQLFGAVARYTKFVLFSKWFLGILALMMLVGLIAWPLIGNDKTGLRISFVSSDNPSRITSPVMEAPRFGGSDKSNQQYSITGKRAVQESPQLVRLEDAQGQLIRADGSMVSIRADQALFHQDTKIVELTGNVNLLDDKGTIFVTEKATINADTMDVDGAEKVEGTSPQGKLVATGFKIRDSGNRITFGLVPRVKVHINKMRQSK